MYGEYDDQCKLRLLHRAVTFVMPTENSSLARVSKYAISRAFYR